MRIISKFHDYYDSVRAYGFDPKIVYERVEEQVFRASFHDAPPPEERVVVPVEDIRSAMPDEWGARNLHRVVVGFCGKAYPFYFYDKNVGDFRTLSSVSEVADLAEEETRNRDEWPVLDKGQILRVRNDKTALGGNHYRFTEFGWGQFLQNTNFDLPDSIFRELRCPVFVVGWPPQRGLVVVRNPVLRDLGFQRIKDPWTCYQELAQYVGNNLVGQRDGTAEISDDDRMCMHGFGHKYAFRKEPKGK